MAAEAESYWSCLGCCRENGSLLFCCESELGGSAPPAQEEKGKDSAGLVYSFCAPLLFLQCSFGVSFSVPSVFLP